MVAVADNLLDNLNNNIVEEAIGDRDEVLRLRACVIYGLAGYGAIRLPQGK